MSDHRLDMREAVTLLGVDADISRPSTNIACPICAKSPRQKKLHIEFDKYGEGVFRCAKCGVSGGPIAFWGLYRGINDKEEAAKDYFSYVGGDDKGVRKEFYEKKAHTSYKPVDLPMANIETRDNTYRHLLDMLPLSKAHRENLRKRGLSDEQINKNCYKSVPIMQQELIAKKLQQQGCILEGVPGFYEENGRMTLVKSCTGILIPVRDGLGRIQALKIRRNITKDDIEKAEREGRDKPARYISLSSKERPKGAASGAFCHMAWGKHVDDVVITEGELKADVIAALNKRGYSVLSVPGVNSLSKLPAALQGLKKAGMKKASIAFDADLATNPYVQAGKEKLEKTLQGFGLQYTTVTWRTKTLEDGSLDPKGLDDFLNMRRKE